MTPSLEHLAQRVLSLLAAQPDGRVLIGITGSPAAGKTTLAQTLVAGLGEVLGAAQVAHVPMDGYHLADVALERLGLRDRKGAPATFDAHGYIALLRRLRENADPVIYAPGFDRDLEQPLAGSIAVPQSARVVVSEGNYLLMDGDWAAVPALLDEVWYCTLDDQVRFDRLLARHLQFGKTRDAAIAWIAQTDEPNARSISATRARADLIITID